MLVVMILLGLIAPEQYFTWLLHWNIGFYIKQVAQTHTIRAIELGCIKQNVETKGILPNEFSKLSLQMHSALTMQVCWSRSYMEFCRFPWFRADLLISRRSEYRIYRHQLSAMVLVVMRSRSLLAPEARGWYYIYRESGRHYEHQTCVCA